MRRFFALCMVTAALSMIAQGGFGQSSSDSRQAARDAWARKGATATYFTQEFDLQLDEDTQTAISLRARENGFDFAPGEWASSRADTGYYHLGDFNLRVRFSDGAWKSFSTSHTRFDLRSADPSGQSLAAADLSAAFEGSGLKVIRYWEETNGALGLRFEIENISSGLVEVGAMGIPMVFNNIMHERTLEKAHALNSFNDPYIGLDAGYVQVVRLNGLGPVLVVVPGAGTPFEAWRPLLDDRTPRGITHEGFYEWMPFSKAYAENEWLNADPWNTPTTVVLAPGVSRSYSLRFLIAEDVRHVEDRLREDRQMIAVGIPGYVIPQNEEFKLFISASSAVASIKVQPEGALTLSETTAASSGWSAYSVSAHFWGRARVTIQYEDGRKQSIQYKIIKPTEQVMADMGRFLTNEQWFEVPNDPFDRSPSIISYDYTNKRQVTEDSRAWIAGLGDEGGAGSWLTAAMKQLVAPERNELLKLERFVDETLWGGLQYSDGPLKYGVRKSLFYYAPDTMPKGTYSDSIAYGGWSSWNKEHAESVGRSFNYPHVAALYWTMYRLARNNDGLVQNHDWKWYLERAFETAQAMVRLAPEYAEFGQMEGTVFLRILEDLTREEWHENAATLKATMRARAEVWQRMAFPFGSEMPWDSTGQEEVYAWTSFFGFDDKAAVTLNAILGYMPTIPHWGYNGSARRYWDFWYGGHPNTSRLERQLHHYGSAINSTPVLSEYRQNPEDLYLLRVGYGGMMGAISNVTEDGFAPAAFHAYPSTLAIDGYSGDYGPGFLGFAINTGSYLVKDEVYGWLGFGGSVRVEDTESESFASKQLLVTLTPTDASRFRVYLAPVGAWLELDAGTFKSVAFDPATMTIQIELNEPTAATPIARLRFSTPGSDLTYEIEGDFAIERDAFVINLAALTSVTMRVK